MDSNTISYINKLPFEMLVYIFELIPAIDLPSMVFVCKLWKDVICNLTIKKALNLQKSNHLSYAQLNFFFYHEKMMSKVTNLNLNGVYFHNIANLLTKFTCLKILQIIDVELTMKQLQNLLLSCSELECFVFTWPRDKRTGITKKLPKSLPICPNMHKLKLVSRLSSFDTEIEILKYMPSIRSLAIYEMPFKPLKDIVFKSLSIKAERALKKMKHLKELDIYCYSSAFDYATQPFNIEAYKKISLMSNSSHLNLMPILIAETVSTNLIEVIRTSRCSSLTLLWNDNIVGNNVQFINLRELIMSGISVNAELVPFESCYTPNLISAHIYADCQPDIVLYTLDEYCEEQKLKKFGYSISDQKFLVLDSEIWRNHDTNLISKVLRLTFLTHLCLHPLMLRVRDVRSSSENSNPSRGVKNLSNRRLTLVEEIFPDDLYFNKIFLYCQSITTLEIRYFDQSLKYFFPSYGKILYHDGAQCLTSIRLLKQLERLTLDAIPFRKGNFLKDIALGCPRIYFLRLSYLGQQGVFNYHEDLSAALASMHNLQYFRLHQNHILGIGSSKLFKALKKCERLERLIICSYGNIVPPNIDQIVDFLKEKSALMFVGLIMDTFTCNHIKFLMSKDLKKNLPPYLCLKVDKEESDSFLQNVPYLFFWSLINNIPFALMDEP